MEVPVRLRDWCRIVNGEESTSDSPDRRLGKSPSGQWQATTSYRSRSFQLGGRGASSAALHWIFLRSGPRRFPTKTWVRSRAGSEMRPTRWLQHLPPPLLVEDTVSGILGAGKTLAQETARGAAQDSQPRRLAPINARGTRALGGGRHCRYSRPPAMPRGVPDHNHVSVNGGPCLTVRWPPLSIMRWNQPLE